MGVTWFLIMVALFVIEGITVQLVSVWFALGAAVAAVAAALGFDFTVQLALFAGVSALVMLCVRPLVKNKMKVQKVSTNADLVIGMVAEVIEPVNGTNFGGRVKVNGTMWSAVNEEGLIIPAGEKVLVKEISGVKLIVEPIM